MGYIRVLGFKNEDQVYPNRNTKVVLEIDDPLNILSLDLPVDTFTKTDVIIFCNKQADIFRANNFYISQIDGLVGADIQIVLDKSPNVEQVKEK